LISRGQHDKGSCYFSSASLFVGFTNQTQYHEFWMRVAQLFCWIEQFDQK